MRVCFCCVCFSFSVRSQEIGWEERLRNELICVECDVEPQSPQLDQSSFSGLPLLSCHAVSVFRNFYSEFLALHLAAAFSGQRLTGWAYVLFASVFVVVTEPMKCCRREESLQSGTRERRETAWQECKVSVGVPADAAAESRLLPTLHQVD